MKEIIGMCPYCKKKIKLEVEMGYLNLKIQEKKVNQNILEKGEK